MIQTNTITPELLSAEYRGLTAAERFWQKVGKTAGSDCWEWLGARTPGGYGHLMIRGTYAAAHRVSWVLSRGELPEGMCVLHRCDNRGCVRPDHLFLGTYRDNNQDALGKGRNRWGTARGEQLPQAKLTEDQVREIRRLRGVLTQRLIAQRFGIGQAQINRIQKGLRWAHV